jgi:integrase/recombinase XerC
MRYQMNKNKYLLQPEISSLEYLLKRHWDNDLRNCLILTLALKTGARAQELLNLQKSDINSYDQTVFITGIKGSNDREIPIPNDLFRRLETWLRIHKENKIFDISYHRLYQIWDLYRPCPKKFHSLRHTFAIELYKKTKCNCNVFAFLFVIKFKCNNIYFSKAFNKNDNFIKNDFFL